MSRLSTVVATAASATAATESFDFLINTVSRLLVSHSQEQKIGTHHVSIFPAVIAQHCSTAITPSFYFLIRAFPRLIVSYMVLH